MSESWNEYLELRDAVLDGRATQDQLNRLQDLVLGSEAMKRDYTQHAHQQAVIAWHVSNASETLDPPVERAKDDSHGRNGRYFVLFASVAAAVLLTLGASWLWSDHETDRGFAMITSTESCRWGQCSLATAENHPIGPGRLRLQSGIATLRLPNVNINLEGEVDIEIVNETKCLLHSGRVFADVEPGGEGFVLQTPTAVFIDQGTTFGVNVLPTGTSDLKVFSGRVDVDHVSSGAQLSVRTSEHVRVSATQIGQMIDVVEPAFKEQSRAEIDTTKPVHLSTATGSGDDVYITPQPHPPENSSSEALLVKRPPNATPGDWGYPWRRKAFLKFDMSLLGEVNIEAAQLHLHGVDTHIGFSSLMPDATFSVYGLTDESQDDWDAQSIDWLNCPASSGDALDVDREKALLLGQFVVTQSEPAGRFQVGGPELTEFLRADTNGLATLILIPETVGEGEAYVHGFASKRHQELPAPTLRLRVR